MSMPKRNNKSSLLSRLRRAVKKVGFLLNFGIHRWHVASMLRTSSDTRRFSFNDRPGLRGCTEDTDSEDQPSSSRGIQRTISGPCEEDVDKRADIFIANFYRQLQMERQVSMELRYCRGNSAESTTTSP